MAHMTGKDGSVTFSGITTGVRSWELTETADVFDASKMGSNYKNSLVGQTGATVRVEVLYDPANTAKPGDSATLTLKTAQTGGSTCTGTAILTSRTHTVSVDGAVVTRYEFVFNGEYTWS